MAASLLLIRLSDGTPVPWLLFVYVIFGLGFGLVNAPISNAAVSGMPNSQAGVAAFGGLGQPPGRLGPGRGHHRLAGAPGRPTRAWPRPARGLDRAGRGAGSASRCWGSFPPGRCASATAQRVREILASEAADGVSGPGGTGRRGLMAQSTPRDDQASRVWLALRELTASYPSPRTDARRPQPRRRQWPGQGPAPAGRDAAVAERPGRGAGGRRPLRHPHRRHPGRTRPGRAAPGPGRPPPQAGRADPGGQGSGRADAEHPA